MMEQYLSFKDQYPDKILLFRMGDFYETFGDDAKVASKVLNITLTARDKSTNSTALAGFPHHALEQYLPKLIHAGHNVVIVDQIENPKLAKGIVKRAVTRIVTPGTLDAREAVEGKNSYLMAIFKVKKDIAVAFLDITSGELIYTHENYTQETIPSLLTSYEPVEALIVQGEKDIVLKDLPIQIVEKSFASEKYCEEIIREFFSVKNLESLGVSGGVVNALAILLKYSIDTQRMKPEHVRRPVRFNRYGTMVLDSSTIRNLEVVSGSQSGSTKDSLLGILDETMTMMGRRKLYSWLLNPLVERESIEKRLSAVESFYDNSEALVKTREILDGINDVERIVGKIGLNRVNGRDLKALQYSLESGLQLYSTLKGLNTLSSDLGDVEKINEVINLIDTSIASSPPVTIMEGHVIKEGYNSEVDQLRGITTDSKSWIKEFEAKEKERTGIPSLKISFNRVFGYYIDVTKTHQSKVPSDYIRKQTLVNSERYITEELKERESTILGAQEKLFALEYRLFLDIRDKCLPYIEILQSFGNQVANIDVLSNFAYVAKSKNYCRPVVYDFGQKNGILKIKDGRHPVVESLTSEEFVSNDTLMDTSDSRMSILTGPNMSGKSTYIRQVAVIALMAQVGSFVPASSCEISLVDRIFTRVGASDDLSKGRSTFMVEMDEAANIVNNATKYSLIILDEIGRGTSTYDGVSIAWALAEHLTNEVKARTLFATHYHELLKLSEKVGNGVKNYNVLVEEDKDEGIVIFLRKIVEGGTDRSYGIYVAQMAGLPKNVIKRANEILEGFEQESMFSGENDVREIGLPIPSGPKKTSSQGALQFSLFNDVDSRFKEELDKIDIDSLTPLEALNHIAKWKKRLEEDS